MQSFIFLSRLSTTDTTEHIAQDTEGLQPSTSFPIPDEPAHDISEDDSPTTSISADRKQQSRPKIPSTNQLILLSESKAISLPPNSPELLQPKEKKKEKSTVFNPAHRDKRSHQARHENMRFAQAIEAYILQMVEMVKATPNPRPIIKADLVGRVMNEIKTAEVMTTERWNQYISEAVKRVFPEAITVREGTK